MKTITITKSDLDSGNKYKKGNIGTYSYYEDVSVEIEENLGYVVFEKGIYVNGSVIAKAGSGITAGEGIVSLYSWIKARLIINAKFTISAGIFSSSGAQDIEAQEITGSVIFGNKKLLPKEEVKAEKTKTVKIRLAGGEIVSGEVVD